MEIKFNGNYEKDLFFRAVSLANQPPKNRRIMRTFMLVFILVGLYVLLLRLIETGDVLGHATYIAMMLIIIAYLSVSYTQPYLAARKMWSNEFVRQKLNGIITKKGILYQLKAGNNQILWDRFTRVRKSQLLFTLVTREGLLVIFPRSFFKNEPDWQKFVRLVETKIVPLN